MTVTSHCPAYLCLRLVAPRRLCRQILTHRRESLEIRNHSFPDLSCPLYSPACPAGVHDAGFWSVGPDLDEAGKASDRLLFVGLRLSGSVCLAAFVWQHRGVHKAVSSCAAALSAMTCSATGQPNNWATKRVRCHGGVCGRCATPAVAVAKPVRKTQICRAADVLSNIKSDYLKLLLPIPYPDSPLQLVFLLPL